MWFGCEGRNHDIHDKERSFFICKQVLSFYFIKGFIIYEFDEMVRFLVLGCPLIGLSVGIILIRQFMLWTSGALTDVAGCIVSQGFVSF